MNALNLYADQIQDIAHYANKIGFNIETGNWDDLIRKWLEMGRKRHDAIMRDKSQSIKILQKIH